jgi:hypothetical protein
MNCFPLVLAGMRYWPLLCYRLTKTNPLVTMLPESIKHRVIACTI